MKIIHGQENIVDLKDTCVILGCAHNVWEDIDNLPIDIYNSDVMCVNAIIQDYDSKIKHFVSFESVNYWKWFNKRKDKVSNIITHSAEGWNINNADIFWDIVNISAIYSGNFALLIANYLNYNQIYLCGMPMDGQVKYFPDKEGESQDRKNSMINSFINILNYVDCRQIYSMSGETKRILDEYRI